MKIIRKDAAPEKQQIPTHPVTAQEIMNRAAFERGLNDARKGRPFDYECDDDKWDYGRGRQFGRIAPLTMPLRIGGRLNPKAIALFEAGFDRGFIV